jgi:hypothetical protein
MRSQTTREGTGGCTISTRLRKMNRYVKARILRLCGPAAVALASCTVAPLPLRSDGAIEGSPTIDAELGDGGSSDGGAGASFATDVFPLLKRSCSCHVDGTTGPALDNYAHVLSVADISNRVIQEGSMPPAGPLSAADKTLFQSWINSGKPNN